MKLKEIIDQLGLSRRSVRERDDTEITTGYASDLLSDVLANCHEGAIWITLQVHPNIVAIASMKGLSAIVLINNREPEEETVQKAIEENMPLLVSELSTFELIGKLYQLGLRGIQNGTEGV